jgi:hypothetical protein
MYMQGNDKWHLLVLKEFKITKACQAKRGDKEIPREKSQVCTYRH